MKRVLFIISLFISLLSYGQDKEALATSDSLFAKGVELYRLERYLEAIPYFEESDRIDKAELDSTSNRRYYSAMWLASCHYKLGDIEKAKEINNDYRIIPVDRRLTVESDSLSDLAMQLYGQNPMEAVRLFKESAKIEKAVLGPDHPYYANSLLIIGNVLIMCEMPEKAIPVLDECEEIRKEYYGGKSSKYADVLVAKMTANSQMGNYEEAIRLQTELLKIYESTLGKTHSEYIASLNRLVSYNSKIGNYEETIRFLAELLEIYELTLGKTHPDYARTLNRLALYNSYISNYSEAIRLCTEALEIREQILGRIHPDYATSLNNLAFYNSKIGNYSEAIRLGTEAMEIREQILGRNHPEYATSLSNLAGYNSDIGNYSEAIHLGTEALEIRERTLGKDHPDYALSLNNLAEYNSYIGNYAEAIRLGTDGLKIYEKTVGKNHPAYANSLSNLAEYNSAIGNYSEAIRLVTDALKIYEQTVGKNHPYYALSLNNLAVYNSEIGNYAEAIRLGTEALEIRMQTLGKNHLEYANSLNNVAQYNSFIGNYSKSIRLCTEVLEIIEQILGKNHPYYAISLGNLAEYNYKIGNYSEAIRLSTEALEIREQTLGKNHPDYATSLNNLALYNSNIGNYAEAILLGTEAMEIRARTLGKDHPHYATSLGNLANYNSAIGNYPEAIRLGTEATEIFEKTFEKEHPRYFTSLRNNINNYFQVGDTTKVEELSVEATEGLTKYVRKSFGNMTSNERANFWDTQKYFFEKSINRNALAIKSEPLIQSAYNATLLAKGILLATDINFATLLQNEGNAEVMEAYNRLLNIRHILNKEYEKPKDERYFDTDSLEREASVLERDLVARSKTYGDFTHNMSITWEDVKGSLKEGELAVEFVAVPQQKDLVTYAAYVIGPDMTTPAMVRLFDSTELSGIYPALYYNTPALTGLVWEPLAPYMEGVRNVYFAPAGELYNIAIETVPDYKGEGRLSDRHNLYRLSSTRELALIKEQFNIRDATLYGGMKYTIDVKALESDAKKYPTQKQRDFSCFSYHNPGDSLDMRSGASDLPGTAEEVKNINSLFKKTNISAQLKEGLDGTEASFKSMSGQRVNLLHVATHGFYWTQTELQLTDAPKSWTLDEHSGANMEDKALTRSGLLFSGANNALKGIPIPKDVEDGILTAKEISELDLRGMDLVVLSACQTGLGEITGDGVFGLQRGFKKAGANTLLMSLWKVDDKATQMLMTKFYEHFLGGKSKRESLRLAQEYLRTYEEKLPSSVVKSQRKRATKDGESDASQTVSDKYRPYEDPKYWAAFILLDALD